MNYTDTFTWKYLTNEYTNPEKDIIEFLITHINYTNKAEILGFSKKEYYDWYFTYRSLDSILKEKKEIFDFVKRVKMFFNNLRKTKYYYNKKGVYIWNLKNKLKKLQKIFFQLKN